jgi:hypothetical protein
MEKSKTTVLPKYKGSLQVLQVVETHESLKQHESLVAGLSVDNAPGSFDPDATGESLESRARASADAFVKAFRVSGVAA